MVGMSLRPKTSLSSIIEFLPFLDLILVMTVEPGFGGQKFMHEMLPRIENVRKEIDRRNLKCVLEVDGGINLETGLLAVKSGAGVLVVGNAIFGKKSPRKALIQLKKVVNHIKT